MHPHLGKRRENGEENNAELNVAKGSLEEMKLTHEERTGTATTAEKTTTKAS